MRRLGLTVVIALACAGCASGRAGAPSSTARDPARSPATSTASARQPGAVAARVPVGREPDGLTDGDGSLWVANFGDGTVSRVDPVHRRVIATIRAGGGAISTARVGRQIWVANYDGASITRIDPATNRVIATVSTGNMPVAIAVVRGTAWVFCQADGTAQLFDTRTARHVGTRPPLFAGTVDRQRAASIAEFGGQLSGGTVTAKVGHPARRPDPAGRGPGAGTPRREWRR